MNLASFIDHTSLRPEATAEQIAALCREAAQHSFASVCVNPVHVAAAARALSGTNVKVGTVVGFPLGATLSSVKVFEAREAIAQGAREIDMVINVGALRSGQDQAVIDDISAVRSATSGRVLKAIIETALLSEAEKIRACRCARAARADFVKTCTGFLGGGATAADVALMREAVGGAIGVKASGGIRDFETAAALIKAGATRLGTSAGVAIVTSAAASGAAY